MIYQSQENLARVERASLLIGDYGQRMFGATAERESMLLVASELIADILHATRAEEIEPGVLIEKALATFYGELEDESGRDF